jgi:hypothetical protein
VTAGAEQLIGSYFAAIRARDADALGLLFHADAVIVSAAGTFVGRDAITAFYRDLVFLVEDLWPDPGPLVADGERVKVEIRLRMNGDVSRVNDFFTLGDGVITELLIETAGGGA